MSRAAWKPFLTEEHQTNHAWCRAGWRAFTGAGLELMWLGLDGKDSLCLCFQKSSQLAALCMEAWCVRMASAMPWSNGLWELGPVCVTACWAWKKGSWVASVLWCRSLGCGNTPNVFVWPSSWSRGSPAALIAVALCPGHAGWLDSSKSRCRGRCNQYKEGQLRSGLWRRQPGFWCQWENPLWLPPPLTASVSCLSAALFHVLALIFSEHGFIFLISPPLGEPWHRCQQPPETAKSFCAVEICSVRTSS